MAEKILASPLPHGSILNVNVPAAPIKGVRITCQGKRNIRNLIVENTDPRGRKYFWLDQDLHLPEAEENPASDYVAVAEGYVSLTPLRIDRTNYDLAEAMAIGQHLFSRKQFLSRNNGAWLSLVEHLVRDQGVGGSNPLAPTNYQ